MERENGNQHLQNNYSVSGTAKSTLGQADPHYNPKRWFKLTCKEVIDLANFTKRTGIQFSCCGNVDSLRSRIDYILLGLFLIESMVKGNSLHCIKTIFVSMATHSTLKAMAIIQISPSTTSKNIELKSFTQRRVHSLASKSPGSFGTLNQFPYFSELQFPLF